MDASGSNHCHDMFSPYFDDRIPPVHSLSELSSHCDAIDDSEGYCIISTGEFIQDRYEVKALLGKGAFGSVIKACDVTGNTEVAIKVMRKNMEKSGMKELSFLKMFMELSREKGECFVRLLDTFSYKTHMCLVFELFAMNLRSICANRVELPFIKICAGQLFCSLAVMLESGVVHSDIKPDNILVSCDRSVVKLCDFGTALRLGEICPTDCMPYLASRYYRAPEVILGAPCGHQIDMWSLGCTLYELSTGQILFPGRSNNEMLKLMMECKGKFPHKLLKAGTRTSTHFDEHDNFAFLHKHNDNISNEETIIRTHIVKPKKSIRSRLISTNMFSNINAICIFSDLLDKCLSLDPKKRISVEEAQTHPFMTMDL